MFVVHDRIMNTVPQPLRTWFIIHFVVDIIIALPLLFFTDWFLLTLNFGVQEPLSARLVGAALISIGTTSLIVHKKGVESYLTMLILKLIWSGFAILAIVLSIIAGSPQITWVLLLIFVVFFSVWAYFYLKLRSKQ